jgi:WD40 repeat protein/tRNA A-37 threonylcarbamoyl transferase component Bud32
MVDHVGQQFGNYHLSSLLGEGSFAEVYLGEHIYLKTQAAIKVLATQLTNQNVEQFRSEAQTIAHLKHPHIVPVHDFGVEGKTPFLVMEYAPNGSLRKHFPERTRLPLDLVLEYIRQVAEALHYAHVSKIIHRDIKPENMLIGDREQILLSDFGIAVVAQTTGYQSTKDIAGTFRYMAPEQFAGHPHPASDQYSLAVLIYEWLAGEPPYQGSVQEIVAKHLSATPPSLRQKVPTLPSGVEQVLLRALQKNPHQRYPTIKGFAAALEQASQISTQFPVSGRLAAPQLTSPRRVVSTPVSGYSGSLGLASGWDNAKTVHMLNTPPVGTMHCAYDGHTSQVFDITWSLDGRHVASRSDDQIVQIWDAATGDQELALSYGGASDSRRVLVWSPSREYLASFARAALPPALRRKTPLVAPGTQPPPAGTGTVAVPTTRPVVQQPTAPALKQPTLPPEGEPAIKQSTAPALPPEVVDAAQTLVQMKLEEKSDTARTTRKPRGRRARQQTVEVVLPTIVDGLGAPPQTSEERHVAADAPAAARATQKLPPDDDSVVQIWDASTATELLTYHGHVGGLYALDWAPEGQQIVSSGIDGTVQIWDAMTGETLGFYRGHPGVALVLAWSPDGSRIASAGDDGRIQVWNPISRTTNLTYEQHRGPVTEVIWSPDGTRIASVGVDRTVRVWDASTGTTLAAYRGHVAGATVVAWSPESGRIASLGGDEVVRVWDANTGSTLVSYRGHQGAVLAVAWSPNGKRLATGGSDHTVQIWDSVNGGHRYIYRGHRGAVLTLAWSPEGMRLASAGADQKVQVWQADGAFLPTRPSRPMIIENLRVLKALVHKRLSWVPMSAFPLAAGDVVLCPLLAALSIQSRPAGMLAFVLALMLCLGLLARMNTRGQTALTILAVLGGLIWGAAGWGIGALPGGFLYAVMLAALFAASGFAIHTTVLRPYTPASE